MNITEIKQKIENGAFDKDFSMLYGDVSAARARYTAACDSFCDIFSERDNIRLFSPPAEQRWAATIPIISTAACLPAALTSML